MLPLPLSPAILRRNRRLVTISLKSPMMLQQRPFPEGGRGIIIREPVGDSQPLAKGSKVVAFSSQSVDIWQPTFKFGDGPLPVLASIKAWA